MMDDGGWMMPFVEASRCKLRFGDDANGVRREQRQTGQWRANTESDQSSRTYFSTWTFQDFLPIHNTSSTLDGLSRAEKAWFQIKIKQE